MRDLHRYQKQWIISVYTLVLVALIFVYYMFLMLLAAFVIRTAFRLSSADQLLQTIAIDAAAIAVAFRIGLHILRSAHALVTAKAEGNVDLAGHYVIQPEKSRTLVEAVGSVADQVQAKMPDEIRITPQAECYVLELRRFSLWAKRKVILVLGLPHISILTLDELRVVLAHELAHLSNGDTRLAVFVFRFQRYLTIVLETLAKKWWHLIDPIYWYASTYRILFLAIASPLYRILELRADYVSARVYGAEAAVNTLLKEWMLSTLFDSAVATHQHDDGAVGGRPHPNIFREFAYDWSDFSSAGTEYLERRLVEEEEKFSYSHWDSHPLMKQRIRAMREQCGPTQETQATADAMPARILLGDELTQIEDELHDRLVNLGE